ncbi:MAG: hypothetical protein ACK4WF_04395 [Candidatus Brocadiales bacterium]
MGNAFNHGYPLHNPGANPRRRERTVILIRCADPRINEACAKLLNPDERPAVISNTGSIKYFLVGDRLSDLYGQVRILVHKFGVRKLPYQPYPLRVL